jgi:hypothetical protein
MKKSAYTIGLLFMAFIMFACGASKKDSEPAEAAPAETSPSVDEDMPDQVFSTVVNDRLQVTMDDVGMTGDTAASMISGYIDTRNAGVEVKDMRLWLNTTYDMGGKTHEHQYEMPIEADGRVPGTWVGPQSTCNFTFVAAKDTFRFTTRVGIALYRFKFQFKPKA